MTNFNEAVHPRNQAGVPGGGQFTSTEHPESGVAVGTDPAPSPREQYLQSQERATVLSGQLQAADRHRDDLEVEYESAALKGIALGIKDAYPGARYLRLEEDDNRYWATGLTDEDGTVLASASDLGDHELFGEDELETEIHALSCTDTRWTDGVTPDDDLAAGLGMSGGDVLIDLDKAAAQELAPPRSRMEAEVVTAEARDTVAGAVDDAIYHLDDILTNWSADYEKDDLERHPGPPRGHEAPGRTLAATRKGAPGCGAPFFVSGQLAPCSFPANLCASIPAGPRSLRCSRRPKTPE